MAIQKKKALRQLKSEIGEPVTQIRLRSKKAKAKDEELTAAKKTPKRQDDELMPKKTPTKKQPPKLKVLPIKRRAKAMKSENGTQTTISLRKITKKKAGEKNSVASAGNNSATKKKSSSTSSMVQKTVERLKDRQNAFFNHRRHANCFKSPSLVALQMQTKIISPAPSKLGSASSKLGSTGSKTSRTKTVSAMSVKPGFPKSTSARRIGRHSSSATTYTPKTSSSHVSNRSNSLATPRGSATARGATNVVVVNNVPATLRPVSGRRSGKKQKVLTVEDVLKMYREQVDRAIKEKKTFTVCGNSWAIRKALLSRGWIEKILLHHSQPDKDNIRKMIGMNLNELAENVNDKTNGHLYKRVIMSKMLGARHQVDLFWDFGSNAYHLTSDDVKLTLINNIRRGMYSYSTKNGLCELMKHSHWYHFPGISYIRHPRSYSLTENGDPEEFIKDFKITAAMSLLKWIVFTSENSVSKVMSDTGKVPMRTFHFALKECDKFIQKFKHEDIDYAIQEALEIDWNQFLDSYYRCVHVGNHFKTCPLETEQSLVHKSKLMLNKMKKIWPCMDMDGYMNIWILKPTSGSRGIGIHICRTLAYVLRIVSERKTSKYVIQKYIERPLLIYNTKFDIRQWFLISSTSPLTIWIYKICYLRFSSQTYNLRKLHESIHLTNNSVQCKYQNSNRDPGLPEYNMWDSQKFKSYLEMIGYPNVFEEIIYPGMKQCITAAILIHQDYINTRKNSFELYGADFMLTEDFSPWLIEINSRPALHPSTPVTARLCPQVLEDVIKVVIDKAKSPNACTGQFELLYKEKLHQLPPLDPTGLQLQGRPLPHEFFYTPIEENTALLQPEKLSSDIINISNTRSYMKYVSRQMKKTLENLLEIIQKERTRRQRLRAQKNQHANTVTDKIPIDLAKESIQYVDNINKVNESIKEIQQILKPTYLSDKKLNDIACTIRSNTNLTGALTPALSEAEIKRTDYSTTKLMKGADEKIFLPLKIDVSNVENKKLFLPQQTDEELISKSAKIEEALTKIKESRSSISYVVDFLKFLNVWSMKATEKIS